MVVLVERALSWGWLGILPGAGGGPPREGLALVVTWGQASGVDMTRSLVRFHAGLCPWAVSVETTEKR